MKKIPEVVTFGEAMVVFMANESGELKEAESFSKGVAGAELNVCLTLSQLGHRCHYYTRIGQDAFGQYISEWIDQHPFISTSLMMDNDNPTGIYFKSKALDGTDPTVLYYRKHSAASKMNKMDVKLLNLTEQSILHLTGITPALSPSCREFVDEAIKKAKELGSLVSFDPNIRPSLWESESIMIERLNNLALQSDLFLPGIKEGQLLTGLETPEAIADYYMRQGTKMVVIKCGGDGAYYQTKDKKGFVKGFYVEEVVDTVGAGDSFASGLLSGLLEGKPLDEAIQKAHAIASIVIQQAGDQAVLPEKQVIELMIQNNYRE